jgi:hypothetical protein
VNKLAAQDELEAAEWALTRAGTVAKLTAAQARLRAARTSLAEAGPADEQAASTYSARKLQWRYPV